MKNRTRVLTDASGECDPAGICEPPPPGPGCDTAGICEPSLPCDASSQDCTPPSSTPGCDTAGICATTAEPFAIDTPAHITPSVGGSVMLVVSVLAAALGGCG